MGNRPGPDKSENVRRPLYELKLVGELRGHYWEICQLAFSPDGQLLAVDGDIWSIPERTFLGNLLRPSKRATNVTFSPDGQLIAGTCDGGIVRLWTRERDVVADLSGHQGEATAVAFSPDGRALATGDQTGMVRLWDAATRDLLMEFMGAPVADMETAEERINKAHSASGEPFYLEQLLWSPDGMHLVTCCGSRKGEIQVWRVSPGERNATWVGVPLGPKPIARSLVQISPDGSLLAAVDVEDDGKRGEVVRLHDLHSLERVATIRIPSDSWQGADLVDLAFSPDGELLAIGDADGGLWLCSVAAGLLAASHQVLPRAPDYAPLYAMRAVAWCLTTGLLATGGYDPIVHTDLADENFCIKLWEVREADGP